MLLYSVAISINPLSKGSTSTLFTSWSHVIYGAILPYRGKNLAGENFGEFGGSLQILHKCQMLVATELAIEAGLNFAKVYFANCNSAYNLPKFSPTNIPSIWWFNIFMM